MLLYLANVRTSTIMLLGWWKSDAFLLYLRRQVKEFMEGVTHQMTSQPDTFFTIPDMVDDDLPQRQRAEHKDPMTSNENLTVSTTRFNVIRSRGNTMQLAAAQSTNVNTWG